LKEEYLRNIIFKMPISIYNELTYYLQKLFMPEVIIDHGFKRFHLTWVMIYKDKMVERYKITPPANTDKYMIIENNRSFIREVKGLKKRRIDWKLV
jgi:hypothetical protein